MSEIRVLVVEDEPGVRSHLVRALRREKMAVDEAPDGEAARAAFEQNLHPVILLDLRLPKLDGIAVLGIVRRLRPETQVVILTGHGGKEDAIQAVNLRAFRYLEKPPHVDDILEAIRAAHDEYLATTGMVSEEESLDPVPTIEEVRAATAGIPEEALHDGDRD